MKDEAIKMSDAEIIVIKIGTSTLTHSTGKLNFKRVDELTRTISDILNMGKKIILVSSGAIGVGMGKLGIEKRPDEVRIRQALAAVGQCELMYLYDKLFLEYGHIAAQVLLTKDDINDEKRKNNIRNTFSTLLDMGIIPVVNENDTVSTEEIEFGDNDMLSAIVSMLVSANLLVILTDINGLYDKNPSKYEDAKLIETVYNINESIESAAGEASRGTGGMITKISAAKVATDSGTNVIIANGSTPNILYNILNGEYIGTTFFAK